MEGRVAPVIEELYAVPMLGRDGIRALKVCIKTSDGFHETSYIQITETSGTNEVDSMQIINEEIAKELKGFNPLQQTLIDKKLIDLDGTFEKNYLGKSIMLGVSKAVCQLAANYLNIPLHMYLGGISGRNIPYPLVTLKNQQVISFKKIYRLFDRIQLGQCLEKEISSKDSIERLKEKMENIIKKHGFQEKTIEIIPLQEMVLKKQLVSVEPTQIGTVTEAINYIKNCKMSGKIVVLQDLESAIEDTFIADLAVGLNLQYVNFGSLLQGDCLSKYNRLLTIETSDM